MKVLKSKKGAGLALIAILILVVMLFLIYRARAHGIGFITYMGDEQAYLMKTMPSTEHAKTYLSLSAKQAIYDELITSEKTTVADCMAGCNAIKNNPEKYQNFTNTFFSYVNMYSPSYDLDMTIPDYEIELDCRSSDNTVVITAVGVERGCDDSTDYPKELCSDISNEDECEDVLVCNSNDLSDKSDDRCSSTGACDWETANGYCKLNFQVLGGLEPYDDETLLDFQSDCRDFDSYSKCTKDMVKIKIGDDKTEETNKCAWFGCHDDTDFPKEIISGEAVFCEEFTKEECDSQSYEESGQAIAFSGCKWYEIYPEFITLTSTPSLDYQFSLFADAHFKEEFSCEFFEKMAENSFNAMYNTLPTCSVSVNPEIGGNKNTEFTFTVIYSDPDDDEAEYVKLFVDEVEYDLEEDGRTYINKTTLEEGVRKFYAKCTDIAHPNKEFESVHDEVPVELA